MDARTKVGRGRPLGDAGQSTVEYLLLLVAFMAIILAFGATWHAAKEGRLFELASDASSHASGAPHASELKDMALF